MYVVENVVGADDDVAPVFDDEGVVVVAKLH